MPRRQVYLGTGGFDKSSVLALANTGATAPQVLVNAFGLWNKVTNPKTRIKEISKVLTVRRAGVQPTNVKIKNSSVASAPGPRPSTARLRPWPSLLAGSVATDARKAGPPWWVYLLIAAGGAVGWEVCAARVKYFLSSRKPFW